MIHCFANFSLDTRRFELLRGTEPIHLRPKAFHLLVYLIEHRDRAVPKQELLESLWPDQIVSEATLSSCVRDVRRALDDNGEAQRFIRTVRRARGYRFIAPVQTTPDAPAEARAETAGSEPDLESTPFPANLGETCEVRTVTVLAYELADSRRHREVRAPQAWHVLARSALQQARQVAGRFGGTLLRTRAAGAMLVFGAPHAQEDHPIRAVLAAAELRRGIFSAPRLGEDTALLPQLRMGLHTGPAVVDPPGMASGLVATSLEGTFEMAEHMERLAPPGEIRLSGAVKDRLPAGVTTRAVTPPEEGIPPAFELLSVAPVLLAHSPWTPHPAARLTPFVGRAQEMSILASLWGQVVQGRGQVVGVVGDPGIGKSRLVLELIDRLADDNPRVLAGQCASYGRATPYLPLLDLLRNAWEIPVAGETEEAIAVLRTHLVEMDAPLDDVLPVMLHLLGISDPGAQRQAQLAALGSQGVKAHAFDLFLQLMLPSSRERPTLVVIEDLHWIDATSEEWLSRLAQRIAAMPILLLVTYRPGVRPGWMDRSYATQIALPPLAIHESAALVREVLGDHRLADETLAAVLDRAQGNPFFLEELALTSRGWGDGVSPLEVPDTVKAVLVTRMDQLPAGPRQLLQTLAVMGPEVSAAWVTALTGLPDDALAAQLDALEAGEYLQRVGGSLQAIYAFKHTLTREAAYESMSPSERRRIHRECARVLAEQFPEVGEVQPELLATHLAEGGLGAQSVPHWQKAAQRALERVAYREAAIHANRGLEYLAGVPEGRTRDLQEIGLRLALGTTQIAARGFAAPEVERTLARTQQLCQEVGNLPDLVPVLIGLAQHCITRGRFETARSLAEQLLTGAETSPGGGSRVEAHHLIGLTLHHQGETSAARDHLERARTLSARTDEHRPASPHHAGMAHLSLGIVLWWQGYPEQAAARCEVGLRLAAESSNPYALCMATSGDLWRLVHAREVDAALRGADEAARLSEEHAFPFWRAAITALRGWARTMRTPYDPDLDGMRLGLSQQHAMGAVGGRTAFLGLFGEACRVAGHLSEGLASVQEGLSLAEDCGERFYEAELHRVRGELLLGGPERDPRGAEACFRRALEIARRQEGKALELRAATSLARLLVRDGRASEGRRVLTGVVEWFGEGFDTVDFREARALLESLQSGA